MKKLLIKLSILLLLSFPGELLVAYYVDKPPTFSGVLAFFSGGAIVILLNYTLSYTK